jgi:hypothetical protein
LSNVTINVYKVLSRAVEEGIEFGYGRAFKHTDKPSDEAIKTAIYDAIMHEICELVLFGDED